MPKDELYTFAEAGKSVGKSRAWLSSVKDKHPEYFENVEIQKIGNSFAINQEGLDTVLRQIKKEGDQAPVRAVA